MKTILTTLNDFTDMKLSVGLVNDVKRESDVYFKLITKDVLLMIQLKVIRELSNKPGAFIQMKDFEQNDKLQVEYFKFDQSMIKVTQEILISSPIKKYFINNAAGQQLSRVGRQPTFRATSGFNRANNMKHVRSSGILNL